MKKIIITCGLAIAAVAFYTNASGENKSYIHEEYGTDFQDTLPGRKKDTTNRKPMPRDTTKKDTLRAGILGGTIR